MWKDKPRLHPECRLCYNARSNARNRAKRRKKLEAFVNGVASHKRSYAAIEALCLRTIEQFGGLDRFVELWTRELAGAMQEKPGSQLVLRSMEAVMAMLRAAEDQRRAEEVAVSSLSDEELWAEVYALARTLDTEGDGFARAKS